MPATTVPFLVVDEESGFPVPGANAYVFYEGPNGEKETRGPFVADEAGRGLISLKKEVFWITWSEAYFAGGYLRRVVVQASGYENGGFNEGFDHGAIDKLGSLTFQLTPFRNRYGGVIVKSQVQDGDVYILELQIVDGPRAGEHYRLRVVNPSGQPGEYVGNKYYLRQSIESIEAEIMRFGYDAVSFDNVLRRGFPDEPFRP